VYRYKKREKYLISSKALELGKDFVRSAIGVGRGDTNCTSITTMDDSEEELLRTIKNSNE